MESFVMNFAAVLLLASGPCDSSHLTNQCHTGNLRLNDSVLQVCKHSQWRIVCSDDWGDLDTAVACRQLGYDGGYTRSTQISNPASTEVDPVAYHCSGQETHLQDCAHENATRYYRCSSTKGATLTCLYRNASGLGPCSSGDIRFIDNITEYEGHIEVCTDHGLWSKISGYSWSYAEAAVACRQLGFIDSIAFPYKTRQVSRYWPLEYGGLACRGNETSIQSCSVGYSFRTHLSRLWYTQYVWDFAAVRCISRINDNCKHGAFRMTNGYSDNNGLIEVCIHGMWTGFCPSRSYPGTTESFSHICNQLGYQRHVEVAESAFKSNRSNPQFYVNTRYSCQSPSSLLDCVYNNTYYGFQYYQSCSRQIGVLCCPNDTALCSFQPTTSSDCTVTTVTPSTDAPITTPPEAISDEAQFSLHFGAAATSLLLGSSSDLRGLKADIEDKIMACVSEESDCPNKNNMHMAPVDGGFFSVGDTLTYTSNLDKLYCVNALKKCLEKDPWIQYHGSDIHLVASIV